MGDMTKKGGEKRKKRANEEIGTDADTVAWRAATPEMPTPGLKLKKCVDSELPEMTQNHELWLLRVPHDFPTAAMDGTSLSLPSRDGGPLANSKFSAEGGQFSLFAAGSSTDSMEASQVVALFPTEAGRLRIETRAFQKHYIVARNHTVGEVMPHKPTRPMIKQHSGLKVRFFMRGAEKNGEEKPCDDREMATALAQLSLVSLTFGFETSSLMTAT